ncbi:MAG TPA: circadian clock KaiB family protein [Desulfomonilaceae bacterium]|nr:circadian clock KaiB family protein [Desulfomonilaceae bacterium]
MMKKRGEGTSREHGKAESKGRKYHLRLYVAGTSRRSLRAMQNLKKLLDEELEGQYELEIIDIYQQPIFAKEGQIVAAPTLVKELPEPLRKIVGDLSNAEKVLAGLDVYPRE